MTRRHRKVRERLPTEEPLDDGPRQGTDAWRSIGEVAFCHWDRWLLRLALDEPEGLDAIAAVFRQRAHGSEALDHVAEAMLAQVADLTARLTALGLTAASVLDESERASAWLQSKAFRRVWHATSIRCTAAMESTPRRVLGQRALCGNWAAFPVSPDPYLAQFRRVLGDTWYDYRATGDLVDRLAATGDRLLDRAVTAEETLAIRRAMLTIVIEAMERCDDSTDDLGQHFREHEHEYLELLRSHLDRPGLLGDLLEVAVWEDYGLFREVEPFLGLLPRRHADLALRELARIMAELRGARLRYQHTRAFALRKAAAKPFASSHASRAAPDDDHR